MSETKKQKEYEELGKMIASIYETGHANKKAMYKASFIKGLLSGLGGVIGATVVVALLIWIFSLFDQIPLVGRIFENLRDTIQQ
jgi:hypothetical protein